MTVLPVPSVMPEAQPPDSAPPAKPAPGFDHALAHAQQKADRPEDDRDANRAQSDHADHDKSADGPSETTKNENGDAPTDAPAADMVKVADATVAALLAALTAATTPVETEPATPAKPVSDAPAPGGTLAPETAAPSPVLVEPTHTGVEPKSTPVPVAAAENANASRVAHTPPPAPGAATEVAKPIVNVVETALTAITDAPARTAAPRAPQAVVAPAPTILVSPAATGQQLETAAPVVEAITTAPAPPPPAADQLAAVMRPLQRNPDGSYQIRIELRPPELGRVDLRIELRDGVLHASIHAEHAHTEELVRNALENLRTQLQNDGVNAGRLTVGDQRTNERGDDRPPLEETTDDADAATAVSGAVGLNPTRSDALLDVRI